ncbi:MAG: TIGR03987 family protein [Spirochaetales bacterium]|nr:TIGR03987 family protein [Spirochaetales bacterium]
MLLAMIFINLALVFYTLGVWAEKLQKKLMIWHVIVFWLGLICDTIGTGSMGDMVGSLVQMNFHGITGLIAIVLMLFHAVWASVVMILNQEKMKLNFHKFSIIVWIIWLVPMVTGMIFGASH